MKFIMSHTDLFQNIIEVSTEGIIAVNKDGRILLANPSCDDLFGYNRGDLLHKNIEILIPEKLRIQYKTYFRDQLKSKKYESHLWGIKKNGSKFRLNLQLNPTIIDGRNATIAFLGDVTQHSNDLKKIEEKNAELIESNRQFDSLINNQRGILFRSKNDKNYEMDFMSEGCLKLTGYPLEAFKKQNVFYDKLILAEDKIYVWQSLQSAIRHKKPFSIEYRIKHKNGDIKHVWAQGNAIYNDLNEVLALEGFICDITPQKEIELKLHESIASLTIENNKNITALRENKTELEVHSKRLEERVQERTKEVMATVKKLVETNLNLEDQQLITEKVQKIALASKALTLEIAKNFPRGLIVVFNKDLKIEFVEGQALDLLDLRQIIYEGLSIDDFTLFSKPRKILVKDNILRTLSGKHLSFETKFKNHYFSINTTPLFDENNEIVSALHVYNDISSQKEIEFTFEKAFKKEKELNDLKTRFISVASHEFRTPLSAILTSAILIGKEKGKVEKREKYLTQIETNVNHLVVILNDFLSLGKLDEGQVTAMPESFDLIEFARTLVKESNISLKKDQTLKLSSNTETLSITLDIKLLRLVLMNLLSNASKYSPEGSEIFLKIIKKRDNVLIQIIDHGIGIPGKEQSNLFQRFVRATNAANIQGTGLGLNIVKSYTELMGGTVEFKSSINNGTTFWVAFPIHLR